MRRCLWPRAKNGLQLWDPTLKCKIQVIIQENEKYYFEILKNDEGKTVLADLCRTDNFQCTDKKCVSERIRISPDLHQIKSGMVTLNLKMQNAQEYDKIIFSYKSFCFGCPIESISLSNMNLNVKYFFLINYWPSLLFSSKKFHQYNKWFWQISHFILIINIVKLEVLYNDRN